MRFISKYDDYCHEIHQGTTTLRPGTGGTFEQEFLSPHLVARFHRGELLLAEREAALRQFDTVDTSSSGEPSGPYRHAGVFVSTEGSINGEADGNVFSASRPEFMYTIFDTENTAQCPPQYRDAFEAVLSGNAAACREASVKHKFAPQLNPTTDLGHTLLLVSAIVPAAAATPVASGKPWASYDEIKGPGAANKILEIATATGTPLEQVAVYEQANRNRAPVLAKLGVEPSLPDQDASPVYDPDQASKDLAAAMASTVPA